MKNKRKKFIKFLKGHNAYNEFCRMAKKEFGNSYNKDIVNSGEVAYYFDWENSKFYTRWRVIDKLWGAKYKKQSQPKKL